MKQYIRLPVFLLYVFLVSACAQSPDRQKQALSQDKSAPAETLSNFKKTTIETSNGTLEVAPTIVSTDDNSLATNANDAEENQAYYDPIEPLNRAIFKFNHFTYQYALIPIAKGYNYITPEPVQSSIANVFDNLREPLNLVNNTLSGEVKDAGVNISRFLINSTIGLLGLFDPAEDWFEIKEAPKSLAQTFSTYNVGSGAYIVLPILGQSDVRSATSTITESVFHPVGHILNSPDDVIARGVDAVDDLSDQADLYMTLYEQASDPYIYFRNQYIQGVNRDQKVLNQTSSNINATGEK